MSRKSKLEKRLSAQIERRSADLKTLIAIVERQLTSYDLQRVEDIAQKINVKDPLAKNEIDTLEAAIGDPEKDREDTREFLRVATKIVVTLGSMWVTKKNPNAKLSDEARKRLEALLQDAFKEIQDSAVYLIADYERVGLALALMAFGPDTLASLKSLMETRAKQESYFSWLTAEIEEAKQDALAAIAVLAPHISEYNLEDVYELAQMLVLDPGNPQVKPMQDALNAAVGDVLKDQADARKILGLAVKAAVIIGAAYVAVKGTTDDEAVAGLLTAEERKAIETQFEQAKDEVDAAAKELGDYEKLSLAAVLCIDGPYLEEAVAEMAADADIR
jgi:hypothetical protein